jgi:hypothetical protein
MKALPYAMQGRGKRRTNSVFKFNNQTTTY